MSITDSIMPEEPIRVHAAFIVSKMNLGVTNVVGCH